MTETIPTQFAYSFVELKTAFEEPLFAPLWTPESQTARSLFLALRDWGASLENIGIRHQVSNVNELQLNFNLPRVSMTVQLTLGAVTVFANNPSWTEADKILKVAIATLEAVRNSSQVAFHNHQLSLAMHLIPKQKSPKEITSKFVNIDDQARAAIGQAKNYGFSIYGKDSAWVVDASALYSDALFVRIVRTFPPETDVHEMASVLEKEEGQLLQLLGLHEDA